jgi:hypothetical protein
MVTKLLVKNSSGILESEKLMRRLSRMWWISLKTYPSKAENFEKKIYFDRIEYCSGCGSFRRYWSDWNCENVQLWGFKIERSTILKSLKFSMTKEEYKKNDSPTINHFYEIMLLKDKMNTATGKQIAKRHRYMEGF